jgi:hypothetical protein
MDSAADSQQSGTDYADAEASHADLEETSGDQSGAGSFTIGVQPSTILNFPDPWSKRKRRMADYNAMLARRLGKNGHDAEKGEKLLQDARAWAKSKLRESVPEVKDVFELKERVASQTYDRFVPDSGDFASGEFAPALWEEGWPSLEDRAILTIRECAASGSSSLVYPRGRSVRTNATEVDFYQLAAEQLIILASEPRLSGKPTQLGIELATSLRRKAASFRGNVRSSAIDQKLEPDFWRARRQEFDDLAARQWSVLGNPPHDKWLRAYCDFSEKLGEFGKCEIRSGFDGRLISDFDDVATSAACGLGCPK